MVKKILSLVCVGILSIGIIGGCNRNNNSSNEIAKLEKVEDGTKNEVKENEDNSIKEELKNKEIVKYLFSKDEKYVFEYFNEDKKYLTESWAIEYFKKGVENESTQIQYYGISEEKGQVEYSVKLEDEKCEIGCNINGTGSTTSMVLDSYNGFKKYEVIQNKDINIINDNEIILGAIMFSKEENIKFDENKLLSTKIEDRKGECSKFDFGFVFKFKLSEGKIN